MSKNRRHIIKFQQLFCEFEHLMIILNNIKSIRGIGHLGNFCTRDR